MSRVTLPESAEDLSPLWASYRDTKSIEIRNQLVESNLGLVRMIVKAWLRKRHWLYSDRDNLLSDGNVGLIYAVEGYDPALRKKFSTYAFYHIEGKIKEGLSRRYNAMKVFEFHPALEQFVDRDSSLTPNIELTEKLESYNKIIEILGDVERQIIELRYRQGVKFKDIAVHLGMKPDHVSQIHNRALYKMRKSLNIE